MLKLLNKKRNKKGFTLIELVVVIAILGILALIAVPRFSGFRDQAAKKADDASAVTIEKAANLYIASNGNPAYVALEGNIDSPEAFVQTLIDADLLEDDTNYEPQQTSKTFDITYDGNEFTVKVSN